MNYILEVNLRKIFIVIVVILIRYLSFSWEIVEQTDEFDEPTGVFVLFKNSVDTKGDLSIFLIDNHIFLGIKTGKYIGGFGENRLAEVKMKIDNDKIYNLYGYVPESNLGTVYVKDFQSELLEIIKKMTKGDSIKISVQSYNGKYYLNEFKLKNFNESMKELKDEQNISNKLFYKKWKN